MAGISSKAAGKLENKFKFSSKELQIQEFSDFSGLNLYDFHARQHDPQIGRFLQIDPMADSYFKFTPYNYVANNPINGIDPDGRDIIFLNASTGAKGAGHAAVIIGNPKDGWFYYSLNGTKEHGAYGESYMPDIGTPLGNGTDINQLVLEANNINKAHPQAYDRYVAIKTTPEEDRAMKLKAREVAASKTYSLIGNSCIDVCQAAYSTLATSRIGSAHGLIDQNALTQIEPNLWTKFLPNTINRVNFYISMFGGEEIKGRRNPVIVVHPLNEDVPDLDGQKNLKQ